MSANKWHPTQKCLITITIDVWVDDIDENDDDADAIRDALDYIVNEMEAKANMILEHAKAEGVSSMIGSRVEVAT